MSNLVDWSREKMLEVTIDPEKFNIIRETLTRIGIFSGNSLYQSCHILHKRGKYYIVHFKEMFALSGKTANLSSEDVLRRNYIANLLQSWGLLTIVNPSQCELESNKGLRIIPYSEKANFNLVPKYNLGNKKEPVSV